MKTDEKILNWVTGFIDGSVSVSQKSVSDLAKLGPVGAVLKCALDVGLLSLEEHGRFAEELSKQIASSSVAATSPSTAYYDSNFASLLPNDGPSCNSPDDLIKNVPLGAIIGFVVVDPPEPGTTVGRRHLLHLMLSLGQSWAIGCANNAIGIAAPEWKVIDLARNLQWIPVDKRSTLDSFNASNANGVVRPARIHYRNPISTQPAAMIWGTPDKTRSDVLKNILINAATNVKTICIERSTSQVGYIRPWIQFRISLDEYHEFFNSPNGMRGIYYTDADRGDAYCGEILEGIAAAINFNKVALLEYLNYVPSDSTVDSKLKAVLGNAMKAGKIWPAIKRMEADEYVIMTCPWNVDQNKCIPNRRWLCAVANTDAAGKCKASEPLLEGFFAEPFVQTNIKSFFNAEANIKKKAEADLVFRGSQFLTEYQPTKNYNNVDIKGAWINAHGQIGAFEPAEKFARNYQIKWFGFT